MDLGHRLKQLRTEKHLSQETVAFELNVSRQAVAKWENNASKPSTANLMAICDLYGISLDELISNKSDELSAEQKHLADYNNDGDITVVDATEIQKFIVHLN